MVDLSFVAALSKHNVSMLTFARAEKDASG